MRGVGGDTGEPKRAQITAKTEREGKPWEHRGFCLLLSLWLTFPRTYYVEGPRFGGGVGVYRNHSSGPAEP